MNPMFSGSAVNYVNVFTRELFSVCEVYVFWLPDYNKKRNLSLSV